MFGKIVIRTHGMRAHYSTLKRRRYFCDVIFSIFVRYWYNELIVNVPPNSLMKRINGVHEERRERRRLNYIYHSSSSLQPTLFLLFFSFLFYTDVKKQSFIRMCNCSSYSLCYFPELPSSTQSTPSAATMLPN